MSKQAEHSGRFLVYVSPCRHFEQTKSKGGLKTAKCPVSRAGTTSLAKVVFWPSLTNLMSPSVCSISIAK